MLELRNTRKKCMKIYPLMKEKRILKQDKTKTFDIIMKPVLTYGAECWLLTTNISSRLQAVGKKIFEI